MNAEVVSDKFPKEQLLIQGARLAIYLIILLLALMTHLMQAGFLNWDLLKVFYSTVAFGLVLHSIPLFFLDAFFKRKPLIAASFVADVTLISMLAWRSELQQSLFLFMFLATIILTGLVFRSRGALLIALLCSITFSLVSLLGPEMKTLNYLFFLILNNVAIFSVAWLGGYLSDQLNIMGERLKAESLTLSSVRSLQHAIVETIPSGLLTTNLDGEILMANLGARRLFPDRPLEGQPVRDLFRDHELIKAGSSKEIAFRTSTGDPLLARVSCHLQESDEIAEKTLLWIFEDLTQIRKLEFAVRQSEKMAAIGQLASGIAHEIRNPLAGISGSIELLSLQSTTEDDKKLVKIILREIDRLNNLITEFLDFAKPDKIPADLVDLCKILKETLQMSQHQAPPGMVLESQFPAAAVIPGHPDKLKQAFLNIVINAYQAMASVSAPKFSARIESKEGLIEVHLQDFGAGMTEEVKKRIFEPFMTTKPKGTGLGLAITHKILETHRAQIFVESKVGQGTEFIISFPTTSV